MADDDDDGSFNEGMDGNRRRPNFHIFTSPLEMERFFNQQMDEILKSFGFFGSGRNQNEGHNGFPTFPAIDIPGQLQGSDGDYDGRDKKEGTRDFMLKDHEKKQKLNRPGYVEPNMDSFGLDSNGKGSKKKDVDLDEDGVNSAELEKLFKNSTDSRPNEPRSPPFFDGSDGTGSLFGGIFGNRSPFLDPFPRQQLPNEDNNTETWTTQSFSFGQSSNLSKVQLPDGSMEERSETTDTKGNKVNKVTKRNHDGEWHCRICVTKPSGIEECQEESSSGYQEIDDKNNETGDRGILDGFGGNFGKFGQYGSSNRTSTNDHTRDEMLKSEQNSYTSLFEKFFGKR